ncbi:Ig-like domain-containing protein [Aureliella helgolandensis]|nr:Ig-like domain-containing protein [Aureliella helgolandensis]
MKKQIGRLLAGMKSAQRTRKSRLRNLQMEPLEGRRLLAADLAPVPFHNPLIAQDVNYDFNVSPVDALLVINELNRGNSGELGSTREGTNYGYVDVNGDGHLSPVDALMVINQINAEAEVGALVTYTATITDLDGNPITQIEVDQKFRLNVFVQDTSPSPNGVFQNAVDVGVDGFEDITFPSDGGSFASNIDFSFVYSSGPRAFAGPAGSESEEFFDQISSFSISSGQPFPPVDGVHLFFSADILASDAGTVTFNLNPAEDDNVTEVLVYNPNATGEDGFRVDPSMISYGSASITIITDPTVPVAADDTVATNEDTSILLVGGSIDLTANDTVTSPRTLSVSSIDSIAGTTSGTLNNFTYTPKADFVGQDEITYTVLDSTGLSSTATITINIAAVNDAPVASDDNFSIDEETSDNQLDVLVNDNGGPEEAADTINVTAVGTPDQGGTVSIATDGQSLLYTPADGFLGTETFTYTVTDSGGLTDTATVTIEVEATILPRARTDRATVAEDSTDNVIDVLGNDRLNVGATAVLVGITTNPTNGTVSIDDNGTAGDPSDDTLLYSPNADFFGTDSFTYTMNDSATGSLDSIGTVFVTVTNVNDPVVVVNDTFAGTEDTNTTIAISALLANDSPGAGEAGSQTLSVASVAPVGAGGTVAIVGTNVVYTPAADFNGEFLFTYVAQDNGSPVSSATGTVTINVAAVNDSPVANADNANAVEDVTLEIAANTLLANDTKGAANESAQVLTLTGVSPTSTSGGTVSLSGSTISYKSALNFNGTDSFTYTISDGAGGTATGTVAVTVAAVNDAPIAGTDSVQTFKNVATSISVATLLSNDSAGPANESAQTLSITAVAATADTHGTVVLNADGTITFTPDAEFTGAASFEYTLKDSGGATGDNVDTATGTVNLTVEEFQPSIISGKVWIDETNDGFIQPAERRLGGVLVSLSGTSLNQTVSRSALTLADGTYSFEDLGPGQYTVHYTVPNFMMDGKDVHDGVLDQSDTVANQFTIDIVEPGAVQAAEYNFAVLGLQSGNARMLEQLASRYTKENGGYAYNGAYFSLSSSNELRWGTLFDGFDGVQFSEAVLSDNGEQLLLTVVHADHSVSTVTLIKGQDFFTTQDSANNHLVRVLGSWEGLKDRSFQSEGGFSNYLNAVNAVFAQEGWDD